MKRLIHELRVLNSARANARSDGEQIALSDKIIVLKRKLRKLECYLDSEMAYTACWRLLDNGITKAEITSDVDKVACPDCIDAILAGFPRFQHVFGSNNAIRRQKKWTSTQN